MRARYYSPDMRRFINADIISGEISNAITLNLYAYANGNPVSNVDPFGLAAERGTEGNINYKKAVLVSNFDINNEGLPFFGHTQLYFLGDNNKWYMTDFFPEDSDGVKVKKNSAIIRWKEDVASPYNKSNSSYVVLEGDFNKSAALAKEYRDVGYGRYNFLFHNCADYTNALLDVADIDGIASQILSEGNGLIAIPFLREIGLSASSGIDAVISWVSNGLMGVGNSISGYYSIGDMAGDLLIGVGSFIDSSTNLVGDVVDVVNGVVGKGVDAAKDVAATVTNGIVDFGTVIWDGAVSLWNKWLG